MLSCISADYTRDYLVVILQKCTVHTSGEWTHFLAEILQMDEDWWSPCNLQ